MARFTFGFNALSKTTSGHQGDPKPAAAVTDADLVISFDNTKITSRSQLAAYLTQAVQMVQSGVGGLTP